MNILLFCLSFALLSKIHTHTHRVDINAHTDTHTYKHTQRVDRQHKHNNRAGNSDERWNELIVKHKHTAAQCDKACVNWAKVFWSWKKRKWSEVTKKKKGIKYMNNNNKKYNTKNKEQVKWKWTIKWMGV